MATLKELVAKKSRIDGDCRIWNGHLAQNGRPYAYPTIDGVRKAVDIHRYLADKKLNLAATDTIRIKMTCGNLRCINSNHITVEKVGRGRQKGSRNKGTKQANVELNLQVFKMLVTQSIPTTAGALNLSDLTVRRMLTNRSMLPYFQLCIQWHTGATVGELRQQGLTSLQLKVQYHLSKFAIQYILGSEDYRLVDEDLYLDLLKQCEVLGDHLVWCGAVDEDGVPVYKTYGGYVKNARQQMYTAFVGVTSNVVSCTCGVKNCISHLHLEKV